MPVIYSNPVKAQLLLQTDTFNSYLKGISDEEANQSFSTTLNSVKWVAGHLLHSRNVILQVIDGRSPDPLFVKLFGKGSSGKVDASYPSMDIIIQKWNIISDTLIKALEAISERDLLAKAPFQTSIPDESLLGLIAFLTVHEAQHLGQLSILKKLVGKTYSYN